MVLYFVELFHKCVHHVMSASRYEFDSVVLGFHEYQLIWTPAIGKELPCKHETHNPHDSFTVAVTKDHVVIGHLPRKFSAYFGRFRKVARSLAL